MSSEDVNASASHTAAMNGIQKPSVFCEKENGVVATLPCAKEVCEPESLSVNMKQRIRTFAPMCTSYFCFYAAMAALFPYLSVYIKGLGITPDEVALLGAFTPLIALVTRPAFALLADKTGYHKLITHLCYLLTAAGFTLLLFIPPRSSRPPPAAPGNASLIVPAHASRPDWFQLDIVPDRTLIYTLLVRFMAFLFFHPSFNLSDALVYSVIGHNHRLFGYIRIFGSFGFLLVACLGGGLAVVFRRAFGASETTRFSPQFFNSSTNWSASSLMTTAPPPTTTEVASAIASAQQCVRHVDVTGTWRQWHMVAMIVLLDVLLISGATSIFGFRVGRVHAHNRLLSNVGQVLRNVDLLVMMCFLLLSGILNTMYETYLFWFVADMCGDNSMFAWMAAVQCLSESLVMALAHPLIALIGHIPTQFIVFGALGVRSLGYGLVSAPWQVLIFDSFAGLTFGLHLLAYTGYVAHTSPPATQTSVQGLASAIYFGFGGTFGDLIGGYLYPRIGPQNLYILCAGLAAVCFVLYPLVHYVLLRPLHCRAAVLAAAASGSATGPGDESPDQLSPDGTLEPLKQTALQEPANDQLAADADQMDTSSKQVQLKLLPSVDSYPHTSNTALLS